MGSLKVQLAPDRLMLRPGDSGDVEVTITNTSQAVEHYGTTVVGLPRDEYTKAEPDVVKLRPGESGQVQVRINLPDKSGPMAGQYTLGVLVRSPYQREISRCEELRLDLQPAPELTLDADPEVGVGGPSATYALRVGNGGNTPLAVTLTGSDQEGRVSFGFRPRTVQVAPGGVAHAELTVRGAVPWTGQEVRRNLRVRASAGPDLAAERMLSFVQKVRIRGGAMRAGALMAGLAVVAGTTLGGGALVARSVAGIHIPGFPPPQPPPPPPAATTPAVGGTSAPPGASTGPSANTVPQKGSTSGPPVPGKPSTVDFTRLPTGEITQDQWIPPDFYKDRGVTLGALTDRGPLECQTAGTVALRTTAEFGGGFLTSAARTHLDRCQAQPVQLTFAKPMKSVQLTFAGRGPKYQMTPTLADGKTGTPIVDISKPGVASLLTYEGPPIIAITFWHANPDPGADEPTIIKRVTFTPA